MEDPTVSLNLVNLYYRAISDGPVLFFTSGPGKHFQLFAARFHLDTNVKMSEIARGSWHAHMFRLSSMIP
jgi:hypothetical protein